MTDHTAAAPGPSEAGRTRRSRVAVLAVLASAAAVVLVAGGGYAAWQAFSGSGPRPADVLPADTFALVSVDLDPSGGQKVEAIRTLRKFPGIREQSGLREDSDLVRVVFEQVQEEGGCAGVDYAADVQPWIGQRAGLGGVTLAGEPVPVAVLQVTDREAARGGVEKLLGCAEGEDEAGFVVTEDYVVLSDTRAHARAVAAGAEEAPLTEDATFQRWQEEAGGEGVVEVYAAPEAARHAADLLAGSGSALLGPGLPGGGEQLEEALEEFEGAAASLRFDDGGLQLSVAASAPATGAAEAEEVGDHVAALPADTAAVLALAVPEQLRTALEDATTGAGPAAGPFGLLSGALAEVGLQAEDLLTVLGDSVSVSVGGAAPSSVDDLDLGSVPLGLLVHGDAEAIRDVVARAEDGTGVALADLPAYLEQGDGTVALSSQRTYAGELVGDGSLGEDEVFTSVVERADRASAVFFARLDGRWRALLRSVAEEDPSARSVVRNLDVVHAVGASTWTEGEVSHASVRVATR